MTPRTVRLRDVLLGRTRPAPPNLDQLFALPSAAITLEAATGLRPTGTGSVCFKAAEGGGFADLRTQVDRLLALGAGGQDGAGARFVESHDRYGFTWLTRIAAPDDLQTLVTDLHAVNSSLVDAGFGGALLCTVVTFAAAGGRPIVALIYLYKRGSWYPFAPSGGERRDNALELQVKAALADDLRIEPDLGRWFPVYDAPGL